MARHEPARVIALGDSFHDRDAADRLDDRERDMLRGLAAAAQLIWIAGNHDPDPPAWLGGDGDGGDRASAGWSSAMSRSPTLEPGEIAGHLHPCATCRQMGPQRAAALFRRPTASRMVLPSFGAYTGGLDVGEDAHRRAVRRTPSTPICWAQRAGLCHSARRALKPAGWNSTDDIQPMQHAPSTRRPGRS